MAKEKKVSQITDMDADFAQWFTDVVVKAELIDYSGIKGFYVLRPYAYAIWENIQSTLDKRFKELGHENVSMPVLIPPPRWHGSPTAARRSWRSACASDPPPRRSSATTGAMCCSPGATSP